LALPLAQVSVAGRTERCRQRRPCRPRRQHAGGRTWAARRYMSSSPGPVLVTIDARPLHRLARPPLRGW